MKLFAVVLGIAAIACGSPKKKDDAAEDDAPETAPAPVPTPAPATGGISAPPPVAAAFAWANPEAAGWAGRGDSVETIILKKGAVAFLSTIEGDDYFSVKVLDSKGDMIGIFASDIKGLSNIHVDNVPADGSYTLEVKAKGDWTVKVVAPTEGPRPAAINKRGDFLSQVFPVKDGEPFTMTTKTDATGYTSIKLVDAATGEMADLIVSETKSYSGSTVVKARTTGHYLIAVECDGDWAFETK